MPSRGDATLIGLDLKYSSPVMLRSSATSPSVMVGLSFGDGSGVYGQTTAVC